MNAAFLTDCHAHLADPRLVANLDAILDRARTAGVRRIIAVSETMKDLQHSLALAERHSMIAVAAGLYPEYADLSKASEMIGFIEANRPSIAAIGEVGLDFWLAKTEEQKQLQRQIFSLFIDLAIRLDLPLNIHSRSAGRHAVAMLLQQKAVRVQLHAFDGKPSSAAAAVDSGYFFSIPPSVVRSTQKQKLVKYLPLDVLLLETDSPVLGPEPDRLNEPANLLVAARTIAELKKIDLQTVLETTCRNTAKLYGNILE